MNLRAVVPVTGCHSSFCLCLNGKCVIIGTIAMKRKLEVKNLNQPLYRKEGRRHLTGDVTMKTQKLEISGIPALLYGKESRKVYLYVHGKMGCKEEALPFAELACPAGYQVLAVDLPEHGERKGSSEKLLPWVAVPELEAVYSYAAERWKNVSLRATSIGAWFSMLALQAKPLRSTLLLCPSSISGIYSYLCRQYFLSA